MQLSLSQTHILILPIISQKVIFYPHRRYETHGKTTRERIERKKSQDTPGVEKKEKEKEKNVEKDFRGVALGR